MKTLRARLLYPVSSPPVEDGMVCISDGVIREWGPWDGRPSEDLGEVVLMPGLINAHCHLDYTVMRGAIFPNRSFSHWIQRINELKRTLGDDDYLTSIAAGFQELLAHGTTTVFNIESFPELMVRMPAPPLRTWWFYEMMDVRNRIHTEDVVAGALSFFDQRSGWLGGFGLSPHAPYTTSQDLYRMAGFCCEKYGMPLMTHLAESDEEFAMFSDAGGALYGFLAGLGRNMSDTGRATPVAAMIAAGALPDGAILTHMNQMAEADWPLLRNHGFSIVHCPCCHAYFERDRFPLERFLEENLNVCLGTDSLASNRQLNLFEEMRQLSATHPALPPDQLIRFVTCNPACAVGCGGRLGEIQTGAAADLIALPFAGSAREAAEAIVNHRGTAGWVMIDGNMRTA